MKKDTKPVAEAVRLCLESTPFIESMLSDGTANYSAIARKIRGDVEAIAKAKANEESILMAVLRYAKELKASDLPTTIREIAGTSSLDLRTGLTYFCIEKNERNIGLVRNAYSKTNWEKGQVIVVVYGMDEIGIACDAKTAGLFEKTKRKVGYENASLLTVHSPPSATVAGFLHFITGPIAKAGISIEVVTTPKDTVFIADEKDAARLFELMKKLIDNCKKRK